MTDKHPLSRPLAILADNLHRMNINGEGVPSVTILVAIENLRQASDALDAEKERADRLPGTIRRLHEDNEKLKAERDSLKQRLDDLKMEHECTQDCKDLHNMLHRAVTAEAERDSLRTVADHQTQLAQKAYEEKGRVEAQLEQVTAERKLSVFELSKLSHYDELFSQYIVERNRAEAAEAREARLRDAASRVLDLPTKDNEPYADERKLAFDNAVHDLRDALSQQAEPPLLKEVKRLRSEAADFKKVLEKIEDWQPRSLIYCQGCFSETQSIAAAALRAHEKNPAGQEETC